MEETKMNCPACDEKIVIHPFKVPSSHYETRSECEHCGITLHMDIRLLAISAQKMYRDESWLRHEYEVKQRTLADIASQFGVTAMAINRWLKIHGIQTRPRGWKNTNQEKA